MFSFHRPKVYRSSTGCCICKAKSSSSRFTDSKKYEEDFLECFKLSARRQGEICNACVLLVKRWKKLPLGSERNWQHVVDARVGPGIKSMTKFKAKNRRLLEEKHKSAAAASKDAAGAEDRDNRSPTPSSTPSEGGQEEEELDLIEEEGGGSGGAEEGSRAGSPGGTSSDADDVVATPPPAKRRRIKAQARRRDDIARVSDFVDPLYWKRETVCCGMIFRGMYDEILIDPRLLKPCASRSGACKAPPSQPTEASTPEKADAGAATKVYSDSSSDSGYDESSNQGPPAGRPEGAKADD